MEALGLLFQEVEEGPKIDWGTTLPPISIKAETLFEMGPVTFTNSMLYTLIVVAGLSLFFFMATRRMKLVPRGAQNLAESLVELLLGITEGTAGRRVGRRIFPLIATLFLFILTANYAGLLPGVGTVGLCLEHHEKETSTQEGARPGTEAPRVASLNGVTGLLAVETAGPETSTSAAATQEPASASKAEEEQSGGLPKFHCADKDGKEREFVPFLRAPNADLNTTLAMALLAVGIVQIAGIAAHGFGGYIKELMTPIFLAPIHIIGEISRVISLSFRLFGNIFGGEVLVTVMYALLGSLFFGFGAFIFLGLELLFGFIQAMIFSILTLVFISTAVAGHAGGHGEDDHGHDAPPGSPEAVGHKIADVLTGGHSESGAPVKGTEPESGTERHLGGG